MPTWMKLSIAAIVGAMIVSDPHILANLGQSLANIVAAVTGGHP